MPILPPEEPGIRIALSELEMLLTLFTGLIIVVTGTLLLGSSDDTYSRTSRRVAVGRYWQSIILYILSARTARLAVD